MSTAKLEQGNVKVRYVKPTDSDNSPDKVIDTERKVIRHIYRSTSQLRANFEAEESLRNNVRIYPGEHWIAGSYTPQKLIECATLGLPDHIEEIKKQKRLAEKLDVQVQFPTWQSDIAGAFPDVPAYVAGSPECMRRLVNQVSDTRPIKIFVGMASSSFYDAASLAKRGALISALALQLAKTRSVSVYAVNCGRMRTQNMDWTGMVRLPMPIAPGDLSYWVCSQGSVRGLLYALEQYKTGTITWPDRLIGSSEIGLKNQADLFGAGTSDIVIPFPYGTDPIILKPELWMAATLKRVNAI